MRALNLLDFLKFGVVVCHIFPIITFHMQPEGEVFLEIARHSTNLTANGSWVCSINVSPTKFHISPFLSCIVRSRKYNDYLRCRRLESLWRNHNPIAYGKVRLVVRGTTWFHIRRQHRYFIVSSTDLPSPQYILTRDDGWIACKLDLYVTHV